MARKPKVTVTDDQIIELIKTKLTMSNRAIAMELGMSVSGTTNTRINRLRAIANAKTPDRPTLAFSEIQENDRLLRAGKRLVVVTTDQNYIRVRRMDGSTETISRKDFSKHAAEYTMVPVGDPQGGPVTTYYIEPGTEPGKDAPTELTREERTEMEEILEGLKEEIEPKNPLFEPVDYIDPEWGVTEQTAGREYMDRIDQLLDIMVPECRANPLLRMDVMAIATSMLERGFEVEVRE